MQSVTNHTEMAKSSKLVAVKRGKVLLVRRKRDRLWMFPGGRKRARESAKACLRREIKEELPKLKVGRVRLLERSEVQESSLRQKNERCNFCRQEGVRPPDNRR